MNIQKDNFTIRLKLKNEEKLLALVKNKHVGFIDYEIDYEFEGDISKSSKSKRNIAIKLVWTHPDYRRQGIATDMIQFLIKSYPNVVWFSLWTGREIEETGGIDIYLKNGFTKLGYHDDYYGKGIGSTYFARKS